MRPVNNHPGSPRALALIAAATGLSVVVGTGVAEASGFAIYEQGADATGRACAVTAVADTPSAIFYNPAGLSMQPGLGIEIGDTLIVALGEHEDPVTGEVTEAETGLFFPPTIYVSYRLPHRVALGFGLFAPYGLGIEWPSGWAGFQEIESIDMQTIFLNPTISWAPVEWLSFAGGFDAVLATVELRKGIDFVSETGSLRAAGDTWGFGGNAGVLLRLFDGRLSIGASWRSAVKLNFEGRADFTVPDAFAATLQDQPIRSQITLPHTISVGVAFSPLALVELSIDVLVTTWSTFRKFGLRFPEDEGKPEDEKLTQYEPRNWVDTFSLRLGAEFHPPVKGLDLRIGILYDRSPSPPGTLSPSLPDSDRIDASAGVGYTFKFGLYLDLAYMYVHFLERKSTGEAFPGSYKSSAHLVGLSLGYSR